MSTDSYGSFQKVPSTDEVDALEKQQAEVVEPPTRPGINPCLWLFHLVEAFNVVVACLLTLTQILPLFFVGPKDWSHKVREKRFLLQDESPLI